MARGIAPRPAGGAGRPQPARRAAQQRASKTGQQRTQKAGQQRTQKAGQQKAQQAAQRQQRLRLSEQQRRTATKASQQRLRQQQFLHEAHSARREEEAEQRTAAVREQVAQLESILPSGLRRSSQIDLGSLSRKPMDTPFSPGRLATPTPAPEWEEFAPAPGLLSGLWGGQARREREEAAAREAYERARELWKAAEQEREEQLAAAERAHEALLAEKREEAHRYNCRIARVAAGLRDRDPKVVESFLRTVLRRVPLPPGFPRRTEVTYHPEHERVVLRVQLPDRDVVPLANGYEYTESADETQPVPRPEKETRALYRRVLAQVALLVVRDVFEAESRLASVTFHGHVDVAGEGRGRRDYPCLTSLSVDRNKFTQLNLNQVSPEDGLARLEALVSPDPYAYEPVAPAAEPA